MNRKLEKEYELVPHTADLEIRAYGMSIEELFKNAMFGMFAAVKPKSKDISYEHDKLKLAKFSCERKINVKSINKESLLIDFLSECLYLSDTYNEAYFDIKFNVFNDTEISGSIFGVKIEGFEVVEIKAVTYHDLSLELIDGLWVATIVFDI